MPEKFLCNEPELLKRISENDSIAFSEIFKFYSKTVHNTVLIYIKDENEAEEIVQQVFIKLWESRSTLPSVLSFRNYFFIAVRNTVFNYLNSRATQAKLLEGIRMQSFTGMVADTDYRVRKHQYDILLEQAIVRLPPQQKQVWLLAEREVLDHESIARQMLISKLTVKKHLELARRSVRNYIHPYLKDDLFVLVFSVFLSSVCL